MSVNRERVLSRELVQMAIPCANPLPYLEAEVPLYEYHCQACGKTFDKLQFIEGRDSVSCPDCGAKVDRLVAPFQFRMFNPFTKDGEGFKSVTMTKDEHGARWRDRNYDYRDKT